MASSSAGSGLFSSLLGPEPSSSRPSEPSTSNSIEAIVADPLGWVMRQEAAGQVRDFVEGLWGKVNESSVVQKAKVILAICEGLATAWGVPGVCRAWGACTRTPKQGKHLRRLL